MIELSLIKNDKDAVIKGLAKRSKDFSAAIDKVFNYDEERRDVQKKLDDLLFQANNLNKEIGILFKKGDQAGAAGLKEQSAVIKDQTQVLKDRQKELETIIREELSLIPNIPHKSVPMGKGDKDNVVIDEDKNLPRLMPDALPHWELARKYNLIDFDLGAKITGAGFPVYLGRGAKIQRALINYFLDSAMEEGYQEFIPPLLINEDSGFGTGQLPDKDGQMYHVQEDSLYLIPTAEVPITNLFRDVILKESDFPIKCVGYTPCFRREAGSYGKDVRGLNRLHQFDKVEIVQIQHPERSYETLEQMVLYVQNLIRSLELPLRTLSLCGGDLGTAAAKTIDLEVYSAAQKRWLEVSSVSNFETYQANRLKLRYKDEGNKSMLAHTLNGSALALPRILASILENNQTEKGIRVPTVLVKYTGFEIIN